MQKSYIFDNPRIRPAKFVAERFGVELKPCPFCGGKVIGLYLSLSPHITCGTCGADGPTFGESRIDIEDRQYQAARAWNGAFPRNPAPTILKV